jgi:hypothetical protein
MLKLCAVESEGLLNGAGSAIISGTIQMCKERQRLRAELDEAAAAFSDVIPDFRLRAHIDQNELKTTG